MTQRFRFLPLLSITAFLCATQAHAQQPPPECGARPIPDLSGRLPVPDYLDSYRDCPNGMSPIESAPSAWLAADAAQYSELLSRSKSAWLVLPAQTQYYGFDRIERALIGAEIADAFADQGSMPDTALVARALGEVRRRYDAPAVAKLTADVGASRRVTVYAGHDARKRMTLTIQLEDCTKPIACRLIKQRDWRGLPFTDALPAFRVVHGLQAEIRREFLGDAAPLPKTNPPAAVSFNVSPAKLAAVTPDARVLSLLAALAPSQGELARQRLSSGALRGWLRLPVNDESRFFTAYAATDLERRPYAITLLGASQDPAAYALRAILDGNLPEAQERLAAVKAPLQRLLLAYKLQDLSYIYGRKNKFDDGLTRKVFGTAMADWYPLVARRAGDLDDWSQGEPRDIKLLLDALAPTESLSLKNVVVGQAVVGEAGSDIAIANFRHLRRALTGFNGAAPWPMFWLVEGIAESDVLKEVSFNNSVQGQPERALAITESFETYLGGNPDFEMTRGYVLAAHRQRVRNENAQRFSDRYEQAEQLAAYWSQGQSRTSRASVFRSSAMQRLAAVYSKDFPTRMYWPAEDSNACTALRYSTTDMDAAESCLSRLTSADRAPVLEQLNKRFHGHPDNARLAAMFPPPPAPATAATPVSTGEVGRLQAQIKADPDLWEHYLALGELHTREGNYAEAQRVYQSYPGFKGRASDDRVALSNHAYEAGSDLFWRGETKLARPLYEFAMQLGTGSASSMTSAARLAQLDGDYESAAAIFFDRATRYASPYAFRDYLSLLHVMGLGDAARSGFLQVADRFETPQVWTAALVDQRMGGMSYEQMKAWVLKDDVRTSRYRGRRFAPYFAMMWVTTDRAPPADFPQLMAEIERDAKREMDSGKVSRPYPTNERSFEFVFASPFGAGKAAKPADGTRVKSENVLLAEALTATYAGQYESAVDKFIALANLYPIERDATQVALAYFALAAAKSGDKHGLEKYIESLESQDTAFDVGLSRAFFAAVRRQPDKAADALKLAFNSRPHSELRAIPTEYQYAEACEIVGRETGDPRFTDMLLAWARQHQQLQPTQAWAYAMEAQYSKDAVQAKRALAITLYLDPASPRIAKIDKPRRDAARAWLEANNPFLRHPGKPAQRVTYSPPPAYSAP